MAWRPRFSRGGDAPREFDSCTAWCPRRPFSLRRRRRRCCSRSSCTGACAPARKLRVGARRSRHCELCTGVHGLAARDEGYALPRHVVEARHDDDWHGQLVLREELGRGARAREHDDLCGNQPLRRVHRQFFTKSFLGDDAAILARSSGEEPASPRHRAGVASMAWRPTRRFRTRRKSLMISTQTTTAFAPNLSIE